MNLFQKIFGSNHTTHKEETKMTNIQKALELTTPSLPATPRKRKACLPKDTSSTISPMVPDVMPSLVLSNIWLRLPSKPR